MAECFCRICVIFLAFFTNANGQSFRWENAKAEDMGFSSVKLNSMKDTLALYKTSSILVIRDDKIILEWYAGESSRIEHHNPDYIEQSVFNK